jgi:hypothetical protein
MAEPVRGRSKFYADVLAADVWNDLCDFVEMIDFSGKFEPAQPYRGLSQEHIEKVAALVRERLPLYAKAADRPAPTASQLDEVDRVIRVFLIDAFSRPVFDFAEMQSAAEFAGYKFGFASGDFFLTRHKLPGLILADVKNGGTIEIANQEREGTTVQKVAFVIDVALEVFGAILGLIGVRAALKPDAKAIDDLMRAILSRAEGREAIKRLIDGLRNRDPVAIFAFLEFLEQSGNLAEFIAHAFAGLDNIDYYLTAAKVIAWFAAIFLPGAIAIKIAALVADLVGIGLKVAHADEVF